MTDFHAFAAGGRHFVFFPRTARLYGLSETAAAVLAGMETAGRFGAGHITGIAAAGELRDLLDAELAMPEPEPAETGSDDGLPPGGNDFELCTIYVAQNCNLSCRYCWNLGGSFGRRAALMNRDTAQQALRLIAALAAASRHQHIFVKFYGGEPLLNFPVVERLTLELRHIQERLGKRFHFLLDTNGMLLRGGTAQFVARHFSEVSVSVDGREEIHDLQRPDGIGNGTWRTIIHNLATFPKPEALRLRGTLTVHADPYLESFRQLGRLGVKRIQLEYCHEAGFRRDREYLRLIVPPLRQRDELLRFFDDYLEVLGSYRVLVEAPHLSHLLHEVARFHAGRHRRPPCGAGAKMIAIGSQGDLHPCLAFAESQRSSLGNLSALAAPELFSLPGFPATQPPACGSCWLRYHCGGGCCAAQSAAGSAQPDPVHCRLRQDKAEVYLYALTRILESCPWHLENPLPPI